MRTQTTWFGKRSCLLAGLFMAAASGLLVTVTPAQAVETIKLTAVSGYPPVTSWVKVFKDHFMVGVDQRLAAGGKYKIDWNEGLPTIVKPRGELEAFRPGLATSAWRSPFQRRWPLLHDCSLILSPTTCR
jgi:hypothetical protein